MALTGSGFADCRKAVKRVSVSLGSFMVRMGLISAAVVVATGLWPVDLAVAFHTWEKRPTGRGYSGYGFINSLEKKWKASDR